MQPGEFGLQVRLPHFLGVLRSAQDFACRLPLRSRPQNGSTACDESCIHWITFVILVSMRYEPEHKDRTHRRIVDSASRQFRAEGRNGPGVVKLMKASGLTHGGFYKHFRSKDDLFAEAIEQGVRDIAARIVEWARQAPAGEGWKEIVNRYLSIEHCEDSGVGCPVAALAPDIARARPAVKRKIQGSLEAYKKQLVEFMPGGSTVQKRKNLTIIFSSMVGAISVARTMSDPGERKRVLGLVRNHLLASF